MSRNARRSGQLWMRFTGWACAVAIALVVTVAALPPRMAHAQPSEPPTIFHATGVVTATDPDGSLTVNHQPIEGLMPAMEMMFPVKPPTLSNGVRPGDEIAFDVEGKTYAIVGLKVVGHTE
jgi:Cu/Ag efflux protein CusF